MTEQVAQKLPEMYWLDRYIKRQMKAPNPGINLRFIAFQFDCMILDGLFICLRIFPAYRHGYADTSGTAAGFISLVLYFLAFELSPMRATPGKWAMRIRVTTIGGDRLPWWRTVLRNVMRFAMILPMCLKSNWVFLILLVWMANFIFSFRNPQRQMLYDWLIGSALFRGRQQLQK